MTDLNDLNAVELRGLIGSKRISPVDLLDSCIRRIETINPAVNAFVTTCFERAQGEAKAAEEAVMRGDVLRPLHGLPVGIKDLYETAGLRTTYGSPLFANHVPERDERIVAAIRQAGAIVVGKTNTPEWGAGGNTTNAVYGPTRNPFDLKRTCGGSSGGSGVALATSMVPLATGSDTGGSLRTPAAYCGVVGFRPSPGLVPSERRILGWYPFLVGGPMGRTVSDISLLLQVMASDDTRDPFAGPVNAALCDPELIDLASLRAAVSEDLGFAPIDDDIRTIFRDRTAIFAPVFKSCVNINPNMARSDEVFEILRAVNFVAAHKDRYEKTPSLLGLNVRLNFEQGLKMSLAEVAWAHAEQTKIYRSFQLIFDKVDVLLCPTVAVPPFPVEQLYPTHINGKELRTYFHWLAITYGLTLTAHPVAAIPCGLDTTGTPFGVQIVGPRGSDQFVLSIAQTLESYFATQPDLVRPLPNLSNLVQ